MTYLRERQEHERISLGGVLTPTTLPFDIIVKNEPLQTLEKLESFIKGYRFSVKKLEDVATKNKVTRRGLATMASLFSEAGAAINDIKQKDGDIKQQAISKCLNARKKVRDYMIQLDNYINYE